jgi:hypothetical protein
MWMESILSITLSREVLRTSRVLRSRWLYASYIILLIRDACSVRRPARSILMVAMLLGFGDFYFLHQSYAIPESWLSLLNPTYETTNGVQDEVTKIMVSKQMGMRILFFIVFTCFSKWETYHPQRVWPPPGGSQHHRPGPGCQNLLPG